MQLYRHFLQKAVRVLAGEQATNLIVGDVEHCAAELKHFIKTFAITDIVSMAVPPGMRTGDMHDSWSGCYPGGAETEARITRGLLNGD